MGAGGGAGEQRGTRSAVRSRWQQCAATGTHCLRRPELSAGAPGSRAPTKHRGKATACWRLQRRRRSGGGGAAPAGEGRQAPLALAKGAPWTGQGTLCGRACPAEVAEAPPAHRSAAAAHGRWSGLLGLLLGASLHTRQMQGGARAPTTTSTRWLPGGCAGGGGAAQRDVGSTAAGGGRRRGGVSSRAQRPGGSTTAGTPFFALGARNSACSPCGDTGDPL